MSAIGGGTGVLTEPSPSLVPDTEARKQVMSPIVDHFVALQADFQKQLAALRELTDNWRHEKDPPNQLGNNKSDNLYERSDDDTTTTILIDANLVPRAVQQALDVAEPSKLVPLDSRDDSKCSLNAMKPPVDLDRVDDPALPPEIPASTIIVTNLLAPEQPPKSDNPDGSVIIDTMIIAEERVIAPAVTGSNVSKPEERKRENDEDEVTPPAPTQTSNTETRGGDDDAATTLIDVETIAAEITEDSLPLEKPGGSAPNNGGVQASSSSRGSCALDATNAEPGRSSPVGPETWSTPGLSNTAERRQARSATTTWNNGSQVVQVGKSAELSEELRAPLQGSSIPQQTDISQQQRQQTSTRNESSIVDASKEARATLGKDAAAQEPSGHPPSVEIATRQKEEPPRAAVEVLLTAVKLLPEQFLTPFITAVQMLSPDKPGEDGGTGTAGGPDVQLMNRLNTLRSMETEAETIRETKNMDVAQEPTTGNIIARNDEEKPPITVLDDEGLRSLPEKNVNASEISYSGKNISQEIIRSKIPDSRMARIRSSVPDIKQQHQDVRSVRTDSNEPNISRTKAIMDLNFELTDASLPSDAEETLTTVQVAEPMAATSESAQEVPSRRNSLEIVDASAKNDRERAEGETVVSSIEATKRSSSSHAQSSALTPAMHERSSIIPEPVELAITPSNAPSVSSLLKEAKDTSTRLLADHINVIEPILNIHSPQDQISPVPVSDSNAENVVSRIQSITETTGVSQEYSIIHEPIAEAFTNLTNAQSTNGADINSPSEERSLNDSSRVGATSISSSVANAPVKPFPFNGVSDNPETTSRRHDKSDTKPIVPKDALHVSEKVEQTISVAYRTPASDDKNEAGKLKENVPVEQSATDADLPITQSQIHEGIAVSPLTDSHAPTAAPTLNDPRDRVKEIAFPVPVAVIKSHGEASERTESDASSLKNPNDGDEELSAPIARELITLARATETETTTCPPTRATDIRIDIIGPEDTPRTEISNGSDDPAVSKDMKISENSSACVGPAVNTSDTVKAVLYVNSVADTKWHSGDNVPDQSRELTDTNNNPPDSGLSAERASLVSHPERNPVASHVAGREDEVPRSRDNAKRSKQPSSSATRSILQAFKNLNIFFRSQSEKKNILTGDSDPIAAIINDATPGISDTFEIKISESPVMTVNDCAPIKDVAANMNVDREADQAGNVDGIGIGKGEDIDSSGNETISAVARNEPVEPPSKLPNNDESTERDTGQMHQPRKSVIARPVVKHRSRSPVKKIVRRRSPVKVVRKSTGPPLARKDLARKSASPNDTTVTKAKATASEITKKSGRPVRGNQSRIRESVKSTCAANGKANNTGKASRKLTDKIVQQSLSELRKAEGTRTTDRRRNASTIDARGTSTIDSAINRKLQSRSPVNKKRNESTFSKRSTSSKIEQSKKKTDENIQNDRSQSSKSTKMERPDDKQVKKVEIKVSKNKKIFTRSSSTERTKDNSKTPKAIYLPSKIPVPVNRKLARFSANTTSSNPPSIKINFNDMQSKKSSKLPVASSAASKSVAKLREKADRATSNAPNRIKSEFNARTIGVTGDERMLKRNHAEEGRIKRQEGTEELPKAADSTDSESALSGNSQAPNSRHDRDPSANSGGQWKTEYVQEESSDAALTSDSEYSEGSSEDTGTARYLSDHNSECESVEELTDAELLLERTLNEIRSEISESEEEHRRSESDEESEDVTCSYETESHDRGESVSSGGSTNDKRAIASSECSAEEDTCEELSEEEQTSEQSEMLEELDKETGDVTREETNDTGEASKGAESKPEIAQEDETDDPKKTTKLVDQPEVIAEIVEIPRKSALLDPDTVTTRPELTSSAKLEESAGGRDTRAEENSGAKESEMKSENADEMKEKIRATVQNDAWTQKSKTASARSAKVGRRASTGSKEIKVERDEPLKGMDQARAGKKRFSLVASCIRRFEGEENKGTERARVTSILRKRQGSPKTEREVSRRRRVAK